MSCACASWSPFVTDLVTDKVTEARFVAIMDASVSENIWIFLHVINILQSVTLRIWVSSRFPGCVVFVQKCLQEKKERKSVVAEWTWSRVPKRV